MNSHPLVSVVIPAYNAEPVIAETLASVRNQTYPGWEALVVDDGSADNTIAVARSVAAQDPRIQCFTQANSGPAGARNAALRHARGKLVAFLDADDVWLPTKLETQLALLDSNPDAGLLFANYFIWDGQKDVELGYRKRERFPEGGRLQDLYYRNVFATSSVLVRRETLEASGPFDTEIVGVEDWDMWLRLTERGARARGVWEPQVRYRRWPQSLSGNRERLFAYAVLTLEKALVRSTSPERVRHYRRSLGMARARLEFAKTVPLTESSPDAVPPAIFRAWRNDPRLKWLLWYLGAAWPRPLGGRPIAEYVYRELRRKWGPDTMGR